MNFHNRNTKKKTCRSAWIREHIKEAAPVFFYFKQPYKRNTLRADQNPPQEENQTQWEWPWERRYSVGEQLDF